MLQSPRLTQAAHIACVDDDPIIRQVLERVLKAAGFSVSLSAGGAAFLEAVDKTPPDLCLLDFELPDASGFELIGKIRKRWPDMPIVMLTGSDSAENAVEALRLGATDYLTKPSDAERITTSIRNALRLSGSNRAARRLREDVAELFAPEHLVGDSEPMERLRAMIRRGAETDVTALITGETGTGKELVARSLHYAGPRRGGPFVDVNCAALTESLLESELFGHERGAFTGADASRRGQFEQAHGGTLFLDEIGDMPPATQAKILRVLQERRLKRVGGEATIEVDVRVVCATNRDLDVEVREKRFREDLFFRINTVTIEVPALRERGDDVLKLAEHFVARAAQRQKRPAPAVAGGVAEVLRSYPWPGNVRELEHAMERAVLMSDARTLGPEHLPPRILAGEAPPARSMVEKVEALERSLIADALAKHGWVKARAARELGLTERIISYKMTNLGIEPPAR